MRPLPPLPTGFPPHSFVLAALFATMLAGDVAGAEAPHRPQWRGPTRTGHAPAETRPLTQLPSNARVIWKVPAGDGFASPIVAGGRVYAMEAAEGKETLRADAADGHELWRATVDDTFKDSQGPACAALHTRVRRRASVRPVLQGRAPVRLGKGWAAALVGELRPRLRLGIHRREGQCPRRYPTRQQRFAVDRKWPGRASAGSTNGAAMVALDSVTGAVAWKGGSEVASYAALMLATIEGTRQVVNFMADAVVGFDANNGKCSGDIRLRPPAIRN